jgi:hypothetical protein
MRERYNQSLATKIQIEKERRELETRFDAHGNVIRDHEKEIRILSESETKNSLPEIPVAFFDGCKKFSDHIQTEKSSPVVRTVRLAPLNEVQKKDSIRIIIFNFINTNLSRIIRRNHNDLPIFNREDESKKVWAYDNMIKKYTFAKK